MDRKTEILEAAYLIVAEEGNEGLHARSVAARIGINHAAVHYYFPKRADLLLGLCEFVLKRFADDRSAKQELFADRVESHIAHVAGYCHESHGFLRNWISIFMASSTDQNLRAELVRHLREWAFM